MIRGVSSPEKVPGLLEAKPEIKFQFLQENRNFLTIDHACQTPQVSRSGFYAYLKRRQSSRKVENEALKEIIRTFFYDHKERYGSVRITQELYRQGIRGKRNRVYRLLHELCLYAKGSRYKHNYFNRRPSSLTYSNLIISAFKQDVKTISGRGIKLMFQQKQELFTYQYL
ncbi:IS3 family transposase [Streptococcus uberis]